jgi:hypothetical protein
VTTAEFAVLAEAIQAQPVGETVRVWAAGQGLALP